MTLPMTTTHHLRPKYDTLVPDSSAESHLFITEEAALPLLQTLFASIDHNLKKSLVVTDLDISPVSTTTYQLIPRAKTKTYTSAFLLANLKESAVYIAGTENFLWAIHQLVMKSGIEQSKIHLLPPISNLRRVVCTHCFTVMDNISEGLTSCSNCQRELVVKDEFSETHGAYIATAIRPDSQPDKDSQTLF